MSEKANKLEVNIVTLANSVIFSDNGQQIKMGMLWRYNPVLFVFLRHFGCVSCRAHAVQVWNDREKYEKNGTKIAFIGNGAPNFITGFKQELGLDGAAVFTDPSLNTFRAAGFKRGFLAALGPRSIVKGIKLFSEGHSQGSYDKESGDWWQLGGILVVKQDGRVAFHYISQILGDYPPENDLANVME